MAFLHKNIWLAFYAIILSGLLILGMIIYKSHQDAYKEFQMKQESITLMSANSLKALFRQHELVLDILIKQLILDKKYSHKELAHTVISNAINQDYTMLSFAVIDTDGKMFVTSLSNENGMTYNLMEMNETKADFIKTLESNEVVIGRTYYNPLIQKTVIPIRKAARDENGNILFVIAAALDLKASFDFFINNSNLNQFLDSYLFREHDRYFQIAPKRYYDDTRVYQNQIPLMYVDEGLDKLVKHYKLPLETIKNNEIVTTMEGNNPYLESFISSIYIKKYGLWLTTESALETVRSEFYKKTVVLICLFIIVVLVFYWLFQSIARAEKQKKSALEFQANHDYLTNLKNRFFLDSYFKMLDEIRPFYLLFIDTDNFKTINDTYGHEYGDLVLKAISQRLLSLKHDTDIVIRYSGDEFIIIFFEEEKHLIKEMCQKVLSAIAKPYDIRQNRFFLTASIGVAQFPKDGNSLDEIKRYADLAMYEAKKEKNSFVIFEDSLKKTYQHQSLIEHELKGALLRNEFYMVYQPQITNEGTLYGVEALLRWENEKLGITPPDHFIPLAESNGLMPSIGNFVIEQSIREIEALTIPMNLSLNISVKQFLMDNFVENIHAIVNKYHFKAIRLVLEVTENVFIEDVHSIIEKLLVLKESHIEISLDDFGTGYSSLSLLKKLPIDELKIDKSFVNDIVENPDSYSMVEGIITIGKKLGMRILAEGIETLEQKVLLEKLGCNLYQGYFYAKPMRIEMLKDYITNIQSKNESILTDASI